MIERNFIKWLERRNMTPQNKKVEYIGDGVYSKIENGSLILMANHHEQPTDIIVLEPEVLFKLMKYIEIY